MSAVWYQTIQNNLAPRYIVKCFYYYYYTLFVWSTLIFLKIYLLYFDQISKFYNIRITYKVNNPGPDTCNRLPVTRTFYNSNLVPRAFPLKNWWGGKRPWHRLVTCTAVYLFLRSWFICNPLVLCYYNSNLPLTRSNFHFPLDHFLYNFTFHNSNLR